MLQELLISSDPTTLFKQYAEKCGWCGPNHDYGIVPSRRIAKKLYALECSVAIRDLWFPLIEYQDPINLEEVYLARYFYRGTYCFQTVIGFERTFGSLD